MKVSEIQKAAVLGWIEKWRPRLFLYHHRIEPIWRAKACRDDSDVSVAHAQCHYGDAGLIAHIEFFPSFWREKTELQERYTLHEMLHIVAPEAIETEINLLTEILWTAYESTVIHAE